MTTYIAITWGLFIFGVIYLCLGPHGKRTDLFRKRIENIVEGPAKVRTVDDELNKPLYDRLVKPMLSSFSQKMQKLLPNDSKKNSKKQQSEKLKKMLHQAGYTIGVSEYSLIRIVFILGIAGLFVVISLLLDLGRLSFVGGLLGIYAGYAAMRFSLKARISGRRKSMEKQLPDVLDILSVNVEAGLGFEQAILHVINHFEGPLVDEFTITHREMTMGRTRREAFALLAERCDFEEIKTFVGSIIQAEQLGISIKNVLRTQAAAMRLSRKNKVEEKAMKTSVKMLLPMVGLIFPVLLIVLMGPAAVKIVEQFK